MQIRVTRKGLRTREMALEEYLQTCQVAQFMSARKLVELLIEKGILTLDDLLDLLGLQGVQLEQVEENGEQT